MPTPKQFNPKHFPVFFEGPKMLAMNKKAKLNVIGPEGTQIRVSAVPLEETGDYGKPVLLMEGVLPAMSGLDGHPSFQRTTLVCDERFAPGTYVYQCTFRLPEESDWRELPAGNTTSLKGEKVPALQILDAYPSVSGLEMSMMLSDYCMGWGICEV
jgi:hypothetical protein